MHHRIGNRREGKKKSVVSELDLSTQSVQRTTEGKTADFSHKFFVDIPGKGKGNIIIASSYTTLDRSE
jgi:hypothetical protein